ncbi:MAG: SpvB/TcaC N-terminal domain-containing protein [Acidobacteriota bacterium]
MLTTPSKSGVNKEPAADKKERAADQGKIAAPAISLPKGGGAIKGIGEKFAANPVTGTGSLTVPIFNSPGRSGFSPQLSLSYDSGSGNGPFGFGWHLSVPAITRKTDKGLPRYRDNSEPDVFILSDAEDLVPALISIDGDWVKDPFGATQNGVASTLQRYRPRVEGLFARIERWHDNTKGESHWRTISKDNVTSIYGQTAAPNASLDSQAATPRIAADPLAEFSRIFSWLLNMTYDDKGNVIVYEYKAEDRSNVESSLHEENRQVTTNRYLKRIKYGNRTPYYPNDSAQQPAPLPTDWAFEVVFDYGEHDLLAPRVDADESWKVRPDPFSTYRAGFEIRAYRLCRRVLMFHHFTEELKVESCLVRSTDFNYSHEQKPDDLLNPIYSFIVSATQRGYLKTTGGYESKSMPPLDFDYTRVKIDETVHLVDQASMENLPGGVDGARYQWIDLDSEGLPGILTEQDDAWFYKRNVSHLPRNGNGVDARFEPMQMVATKPSLANLERGQQLMDLAGDGQLCLVQFGQPLPGYYERDPEGEWQPFIPFSSSPNVDWKNPNLKSVDLNGDGHADILITEDEVFTWYPSRAKDGFGPAETVRKVIDEEKGPALVFADGTESIYLADLSGDGLADIVRIRNGEVCYWPNLGYARFGAKITMTGSPTFDFPDQFDHKRIRLADVDGSGATDIIYLGRNKVSLYFNQAGNSWSKSYELAEFPDTDNLASVTVVDLLGNGTACLVWSSPLPADQFNSAAQPMRYIDLMGGQKPHLLVSTSNNLGAETKVQYAASTRFYLQDRADGKPWITRLPFPVHVVERVETYDYISQTKFAALYKYHHGYFDGPEREFRGFGMVEQFDTESFSRFSGAGLFTETPETAGEEFHLPQVHTKTWFHNGAYVAQDNISRQYEDEYYKGDTAATRLPDTILPSGLTAQEEREACRALKGSILRQEVYADDGSDRAAAPYSATEYTYHLRLIQPVEDNPHAVFYPYECESLAYHYERNPNDPRIAHQVTLEVDEFGNALKSAAVGYPRRPAAVNEPPHPSEQTQTLITYTDNRVKNKADEADWYRIGVSVETRTYELTGFVPADGEIFSPADFIEPNQDQLDLRYDTELAYEETETIGRQRRLIERVRTLYLKNDLSGPLPLDEIESLGLPYESYKMAFTPGLLDVFSEKIASAATLLTSVEAGYKDLDGDGALWIPSGLTFFSPVPKPTPNPITQDPVFAREHFYLPQGSEDPFGNVSRATHDIHDLLTIQTEDALGNIVSALNDYRALQPAQVTDPNNNRAAVGFDALGMVAATAVMGKKDETDPEKSGDTLDDPTTRLEYDLFNWMQNGSPNFVHTFAREQHGAANRRWQESFSYSDGLGREVMKKIQAEPGMVRQLDSAGDVIEVDTSPELRWVGTGRVVFDNKGNPVKKYEPFFSATPEYETEEKLVVVGVTPILRYDPLSRLIRTDLPNGTFSKVEFDPWQQITFDENDTVIERDVNGAVKAESRWYLDRIGGQLGAHEKEAATKAAAHAGTSTVAHLDTLGRTFLTIADNGTAHKYETRVELDIEGNQRSVTDALGRKVMTYDYDMLGSKLQQVSMDAGARWMLNDVAGKPIRLWDSRNHTISTTYDELRRPVRLFVSEGSGGDRLVERTSYGEPVPDDPAADAAAKARNLRGKVFQQFDGAGVITNDQYDFKGNLLSSTRQLLQNYKAQVDWFVAPALESETFTSSTSYDALNRPVALTTPHNETTPPSVIRPSYNEANLLQQVNVNLRGADDVTAFVINIDYDAKGQRKLIEYADRTTTEYEYDKDTFRLIHLKTNRAGFPSDEQVVQDLSYTYDPVGNITHIRDDADIQNVVYFRNKRVEPSADYEYDAIYRLTSASGREHLGQTADKQLKPPRQIDHDDSFRMNLPHPGDGNAMGNYNERYEYDSVGNILQMIHEARLGGGWTRRYDYEQGSNRLRGTSLPGDADGQFSAKYEYDAHGSMTKMPHLPVMEWDFQDQLRAAQQQVVNGGGTAEKAYYVYDAAGERVRKVIQRPGGSIKEERIYLDGIEIFRQRDVAGSVTLERETLHIMDDKQRIALVETKTVDVDAPASSLPSTLTRYQFANHLGSACLELDERSAVISYEEYYPYGSTSYQATRNGIETSPKRYRYTGQERDEETGLYYHGARYYAPWLGRWTETDPAGIFDGTNLYAYTCCRPTTHSDPSGTQSKGAQLCDWQGNCEPWWDSEVKVSSPVSKPRTKSSSASPGPKIKAKPTTPATPTEPASAEPESTTPVPVEPSPPASVDTGTNELATPSPAESEKEDIYNEVVLGDLFEGKSTWTGTLINVGTGVIPFVGQAADFRDTVAAVRKVSNKPRSGLLWFNLGMAAVAWVPVIGDVAKAGGKAVKKSLQKGSKQIKVINAAHKGGTKATKVVKSAYQFKTHLHHVFPQKFFEEFQKLGIHVDDYVMRLKFEQHIGREGVHVKGDYNGRWEDFFNAARTSGKKLTKKDAEEFLIEILNDLGIAGNLIGSIRTGKVNTWGVR